ncbi:hypothetical protein [Streptomyces paludis]|uniref:Uncharacterized protein n=1 Tax=Streptomyces paludis TaxID=2282738 RepID=A0A345HRS5_9ACTN|nr:hypothetical protein [Streptomyces paludis]AXG79399.1 hypothetical protein DVK44_19035 [Streptomyces paludis]
MHAARTLPLLCGVALGVTVCAVPVVFSLRLDLGAAAVLLHLTAVLGGLGLAFLLDDPATATTAMCPSPWWLRRSLRITTGLLALTPAWILNTALVHHALPPDTRPALPRGDLAVEALALALLVVALALLGLRLTRGGYGSQVAASGLVVVTLTFILLPQSLEFFTAPTDPTRWHNAALRWRALSLTALLATLTLLPRQPTPRR